MAKIRDLARGALVTFAGRQWYLLDPGSGYMMGASSFGDVPWSNQAGDNRFNPLKSGHLGFWLNTTYYNVLSENEKNAILTKSWIVDGYDFDGYNYSSTTVGRYSFTAKIGLLSIDEYKTYSKKFNGSAPYDVIPSSLYGFFLRNSYHNDGATNVDVPILLQSYGVTSGGITAPVSVVPTLYINPDTMVVNNTVTYNTAPTQPGAFTNPVSGSVLFPNSQVTVAHGPASDAEGNLSHYEVHISYNGGGYVPFITGYGSFTYTPPADKSKTAVAFAVRGVDTNGAVSEWTYSPTYTINQNTAPTITLNTANNKTLYENDMFKIDGTALEVDAGDILNVYYRINSGTSRAIATGISTGSPIPFNEQLTFKGGQLFKDATAITGPLTEGTAHKLEVWSEDNKGGKSVVAERTFYVVPNRAPSLTIDSFESLSDLINADTITFKGSSFDLDGNDVVVSYKVNNGLATQIHSGAPGPFEFNLPLSALKVGANTIIVEVTDSYNFKSSKTIKLNKTANLTPLSQSVQRYKIVSPTGSAQGVLLWIQREESATVSAEISMTNGTEQESYSAMTLSNTAPVSLGIVEDQFQFQADSAKENIVVKLNISGGAVTLVSGVLS